MTERPFDPRSNLEITSFIRSDVAERYDRGRPAPPEVLLDLLESYAATPLRLVVDIGSGTGLSTLPWATRASQVVGVEPSAAMRTRAEAHAREEGRRNVSFVDGTGDATGLATASAQLITCAQAFHYMEPRAALAEVSRVLAAGGAFVVYDYAGTPQTVPDVERAYEDCQRRLSKRCKQLGLHDDLREWDMSGHTQQLRDSGHFRTVRESVLVAEDSGSTARLLALARANREYIPVRDAGATDAELGLTRLEEVARKAYGSRTVTWRWTYRVRVGFK